MVINNFKARNPDGEFADRINFAMMAQAFLTRPGSNVARLRSVVMVAFETELEAEEFYRLLASRRIRS